MKHLNEITALSRAALAGDTQASNEAIERLLEAVMAEDPIAFDALLKIWDSARLERISGMQPVRTTCLKDMLVDMVIPEPDKHLLRIACPKCAKRFWLYGTYFDHWEGMHQISYIRQRV